MNRRGFALLATLWVITALTVLGAVGVAAARTGQQATRNRILLARAGWAREACVEILLARFAQDSRVRDVQRTDLGRGAWCRARLEDPGSKLNVNQAEPQALRTVLCEARSSACADSLFDGLLAARRHGPFRDVRALLAIPGFDSALVGDLEALLTTRGSDLVNLNLAPPAVLRTVPGLGEEAVLHLMARRAGGRSVRSMDELVSLLSPPARRRLFAVYPEFMRTSTFGSPQLHAVVEGGVEGTPLTSRADLTIAPTPERLAVIRRETR